MGLKVTSCKILFLFLVMIFLGNSGVKADNIFDRIRAFTPEESIRQSRITDSVRAMTVPGSGGNPSNQNIDSSCQSSNPGALNGIPCCRHLVTKECKLVVSRGLCPSGFRYDVNNECGDYCDDPPVPSPSPSPSASASRSPSPSQSPRVSPSPSQSVYPSNIKVIEISDSNNNHPDYDNYANNTCVVQGGRKVANGAACEFRTCAFLPFQVSFTTRLGSSVLRSNHGCNSNEVVNLCNWDCRGIEHAIMQYGSLPPPPPPVTRSPAASRSVVASRSATPSRSRSPSQSRSPGVSASRAPSLRHTSTPSPSRKVTPSRPTVTPSRYSNSGN